MGILLVYDVTNEQTFLNVKNWMRQIDTHAAENVCRVLIGNKCDVPADQRVVSYEQGKALADEFGVAFFETSAKENLHVDDAFMQITNDIVARLDDSDTKTDSEHNPLAAAAACTKSRAASPKRCHVPPKHSTRTHAHRHPPPAPPARPFNCHRHSHTAASRSARAFPWTLRTARGKMPPRLESGFLARAPGEAAVRWPNCRRRTVRVRALDCMASSTWSVASCARGLEKGDTL